MFPKIGYILLRVVTSAQIMQRTSKIPPLSETSFQMELRGWRGELSRSTTCRQLQIQQEEMELSRYFVAMPSGRRKAFLLPPQNPSQ